MFKAAHGIIDEELPTVKFLASSCVRSSLKTSDRVTWGVFSRG